MQQIQAIIRRMHFDEQVEYGMCNRGLMLEQNGRAYRLTSGTTDSIYVFKSGPVTYVLTINLNLEYLGFDAFIGSEQDAIDSIFLQGDYAISECIDKNWHSLPLTTLATKLIQLFA
ncbi:MAG TPA: hypothetical protein VHT73_19415 [Thermodesulfobacteriota bacterium]|nr:hypothetical protein [Thermodesulfobacteriota bacterium]